jgi:hypothetical protein
MFGKRRDGLPQLLPPWIIATTMARVFSDVKRFAVAESLIQAPAIGSITIEPV